MSVNRLAYEKTSEKLRFHVKVPVQAMPLLPPLLPSLQISRFSVTSFPGMRLLLSLHLQFLIHPPRIHSCATKHLHICQQIYLYVMQANLCIISCCPSFLVLMIHLTFQHSLLSLPCRVPVCTHSPQQLQVCLLWDRRTHV